MMNLSDLKQEVLAYAKKAYQQALMAGTSGNLSVLSEDGKLVITPGGIDYMTMTAEDVMVIDLDGNVLEGPHRPSSEWPMHAEIYKHRPDVRSIVHTHSPYATAFSVLNEPIPLVLVEMVYFLLDEVPTAPIALQGSADVGLGIVQTIGDKGVACLMQNHGAVTLGGNLSEAFIRTEYLEEAAKIYHMARTIGTPTRIPEAMVREMQSRVQ